MGVIIIDGMTSAQNALKEIDNAKKKLDQAIENYKFALTQLGNNRITIKLEGERDEKSSQRGVLDE